MIIAKFELSLGKKLLKNCSNFIYSFRSCNKHIFNTIIKIGSLNFVLRQYSHLIVALDDLFVVSGASGDSWHASVTFPLSGPVSFAASR